MKPPDHLSKVGKDFWNEIVPSLIEVGIVDRIDAAVIEQMATQFSRIREAQAIIKQHGLTSFGHAGQLTVHPAVKIEREATTLFLKLAEQYALTPVARTRLGLAELHRRSMKQEMDERIGAAELQPA